MELWKEVVGSNGRYLVSSEGRVMNAKTKRILRTSKDQRGYEKVAMFKMDRNRRFKVHRVVAMAFIPNPEGKKQVNHIDGNKQNNRADNLEWVSNEENMHHARKTGLFEGHEEFCESRKKPVIATNILTGEVKEFESLLSSMRYFDSCHIPDVIKGKRKQAKGWTFRYKEVMPDADTDNAETERETEAVSY